MSFWRDNPVRLLFTWTRWLHLRHPTIRLVNVTMPLGSFVICFGAAALLPHFNLSKDLGLIQQVNGLLQMLAPFFVAALALIAGFPGDALDKPMGGIRPYLRVVGEEHYPTRRQLLGYLFAYLSALTILTYLSGGLIIAASNPVPQAVLLWLARAAHGYVGLCIKGAYGALLIHVFAVTLLGLHFLGNFMTSSMISRDNPDPGWENPGSSSEPPSAKPYRRQLVSEQT